MPKPTTEFDFEKTLKELEQLVEKMEAGELGLEDSLRQFEHGIALTRSCQAALTRAEQKVRILLQDDDTSGLDDFSSSQDN